MQNLQDSISKLESRLSEAQLEREIFDLEETAKTEFVNLLSRQSIAGEGET